jgi:hypothetical protein
VKTTYRIVLIPRGPSSRFNPHQVIESDAPPRFEGGVVIITRPRWLPGPDDPGPQPEGRGPSRQAWPLDLVAAVVEYDIEHPDDDQ